MGSLWWLLGIGIKRDRENWMISFSQTAYIQRFIEQFRMEDAKPPSVPINLGHNLTKSQSPSDPQGIKEMKCIPYREAVGSLMYMVIGMQLDIPYTMSYLARFMVNPGHAHWETVKHVIRSEGNEGCRANPQKGQHNHLGGTGLPEPLWNAGLPQCQCELSGASPCDLWLCTLHIWGSNLLELQETDLGIAFHHRVRICGHDTCNKEGIMDKDVFGWDTISSNQANAALLQQSVSHYNGKEQSVSYMHQAHWHMLPFHSPDSYLQCS